MKQARWDTESAEARALLELARTSEPHAPLSEDVAARAFVAAFRSHTQRRTVGSVWAALGAWRYGVACAAALAVALVGFQLGSSSRGEPPLSYHLKSGGAAGRVIDAKGGPVELGFSDGTVVTVEGGARAQVSETTERGARFRLDSGRMAFDVVPRPNRGNWSVDAGPFQVRVTGTVFTVDWNASEGSLRVEVTRGHVVVEGAGQRRELGPGDSFEHRGRVPAAPVAEAARERALEAPSAPLPPVASSPAADKPLSWAQLVAAGSFDAVLDAASKRGVPACLEACSREEVRALADAARLSGRAALAERALLAQRARFPGTGDATAAAFLLGRAAEEREDARAVGWYDRYLAEAPQGRFAADALGRKMMFVARRDATAAAALAEQYLARFPAGPYAAHARNLRGR